MKAFTSLIVLIIAGQLMFAQNYWQGDTPGQETNWNEARNWSKNRVPDWRDEVIIPDVSSKGGFYPIIDTETYSIAALKIMSGARLTLLEQ